MMPMPNFARSSSTESLSAIVSQDLAHVVQAQAVLRNDVPQLPLVVAPPTAAIAPWKYERYFFAASTAANSSFTRMSTTPFGTWNDIGPTSSGV